MPGWIPLNSAASGAAFAGVLAALVITISVQISTSTKRSSHRVLSLKASPPTLVTLMVASYLYIVLDGIPNTSEEVRDVVLAGHSTEGPLVVAAHYADIASKGFSLAGSTLALGTFMTLFIVTASIFDNTPAHGKQIHADEWAARDWALAVLRVAALTECFILLLGYKVGAEIGGDGTPCWWWMAHTAALFTPVLFAVTLPINDALLGRVASRLACVRKAVSPTGLVFLMAAGPAVVTLSLITTSVAERIDLAVVSLAGSVYFGVASAGLLVVIEEVRRSGGSRASADPSASG